jgi:deazaflavin-dependent oxidoreductase (nitroreductase family)
MKDASVKRWSRVHKTLFRMTRGYLGSRLVHNDMCLLTTTGRRSGKTHTVPLLYLDDGGRLVVIASYGGRDHYPDWYLNLCSDPDATVQEPHSSPRPVRARTASEEERELWWPRIVAAYDGYAVYQSRTTREIPVVFLEPV